MRLIFTLALFLFLPLQAQAFSDESGAMNKTGREVPEALLEVDYQNCYKSCTANFEGATCETLCKCTAREFKKRLDFDHYLDLRVQLARNEIRPESRKFLDEVAKFCAAVVEKKEASSKADSTAADQSRKTEN